MVLSTIAEARERLRAVLGSKTFHDDTEDQIADLLVRTAQDAARATQDEYDSGILSRLFQLIGSAKIRAASIQAHRHLAIYAPELLASYGQNQPTDLLGGVIRELVTDLDKAIALDNRIPF